MYYVHHIHSVTCKTYEIHIICIFMTYVNVANTHTYLFDETLSNFHGNL